MTPLIIAAVATTAISFLCESIFGFGGGLMSIPILTLLLGVRDGVTFVLLFQLLMGLLIFQSYKDIQWKVAIPMTVGLAVGTI
jgi:uncharacterized membrane protein YfcA